MTKFEIAYFEEAPLRAKGTVSRRRVCVGDTLRDCSFPATVQYHTQVEVIDLDEFKEELFTGAIPDVIYSAVVSDRFDCIDLAALLHRVGYRGRYRVVAPDMPNPELIRREVCAICPGLDFDLVALPPRALLKVS